MRTSTSTALTHVMTPGRLGRWGRMKLIPGASRITGSADDTGTVAVWFWARVVPASIIRVTPEVMIMAGVGRRVFERVMWLTPAFEDETRFLYANRYNPDQPVAVTAVSR